MKKVMLIPILMLILVTVVFGANSWENSNWYYLSIDDADRSGNTIYELNNNKNLTNSGLTLGVSGIVNEAAEQTGNSGDRISGTHSEYQNLGTSNGKLILSAWVNPDTMGSTARVIIADWHDGSGKHFLLRTQTDSKVYFYADDGSTYSVNAALSANVWTHVCAIVDGGRQIIMLNGSTAVNTSTGIGSLTTGAGTIAIGEKDGTNSNQWDGHIDEIYMTDNFSDGGALCTDIFNQGSSGLGLDSVDSTPPTISDINCTSPSPDDTAEPFWTNDNTPTFKMTTDESATCGLSNTNSSYNECSTTGGTSHTCTINSSQALSDGTVYVYTNCTDGSSNSRTNQHEMYVDTENPAITFNSPTSQTYYDTLTVSLNVTATDNTNVANISRYVNTTLNSTNSSPVNNSAWINSLTVSGFQNWSVYFKAWDNVSTYNSNTSSTNWYSFSDNPPVVTFNSPTSQTYYNQNWTEINCSAYDNYSISQLDIYVNGTLNVSNTTVVNNTAWVYNFSGVATNYSIYCNATDSSSNSVTTSTRWFNFVDDLTNPTISINSPDVNQVFRWYNYYNTSFNCTATDAISLENITLFITDHNNLNSAQNESWNVSGTSGESNITVYLVAGTYTWFCQVSDSAGNKVNSSTRYFEIQKTVVGGGGGSGESGEALYQNFELLTPSFTINDDTPDYSDYYDIKINALNSDTFRYSVVGDCNFEETTIYSTAEIINKISCMKKDDDYVAEVNIDSTTWTESLEITVKADNFDLNKKFSFGNIQLSLWLIAIIVVVSLGILAGGGMFITALSKK